MTDVIRKKHEEWKAKIDATKTINPDAANAPTAGKIASILKNSEVDALFKALDEARGKTKKPKVCRLCGKTLKKSHKYINVGNGEVEHRSCISPISYPFMGPLRKETDHEA